MAAIGIIGAGRVAKALARRFTHCGLTVLISNSRGPHSLYRLSEDLGPLIKPVLACEAAKEKIVLLAVPWNRLEQALSNLPSWEGRILIDATNPSISFGAGLDEVGLATRTSTELVADLVPGARVVKAFNTLDYKSLKFQSLPSEGGRIIFMSGDDRFAKRECGNLIKRIGFEPVDLGKLIEGGRMHQIGGPLAHLKLIKVPF